MDAADLEKRSVLMEVYFVLSLPAPSMCLSRKWLLSTALLQQGPALLSDGHYTHLHLDVSQQNQFSSARNWSFNMKCISLMQTSVVVAEKAGNITR